MIKKPFNTQNEAEKIIEVIFSVSIVMLVSWVTENVNGIWALSMVLFTVVGQIGAAILAALISSKERK